MGCPRSPPQLPQPLPTGERLQIHHHLPDPLQQLLLFLVQRNPDQEWDFLFLGGWAGGVQFLGAPAAPLFATLRRSAGGTPGMRAPAAGPRGAAARSGGGGMTS